MPTWDRAQQSAKSRFHFHRKSETLPSQTHSQVLGTHGLQPQSIGSSWEHLGPVASVLIKILNRFSWREKTSVDARNSGEASSTVGWLISSLSKSACRTWEFSSCYKFCMNVTTWSPSSTEMPILLQSSNNWCLMLVRGTTSIVVEP